MTDRVIDASALILRLLPTPAGAAVRHQVPAGTYWHAPHLIDAECGQVLRRAVGHGDISPQEGRITLETAAAFVDMRHDHRDLAIIAWSLRDKLTYYDALYVALAVRLDLPLVTADRRLANAPKLPCVVEVVGYGRLL